ncbi:hypothetical protein COU57_06255 [Candidatus Pacearchaeota archaeon CG10_big_fil_rev_8_21_14_0_10_32_14]|nr:MAG: hypothetical protein COU57_06255 [Candidatus Pacearchaeota archaeon CG10_big_fil_rev_8_21_14_0_10_32_14]
MSIKNKGENEMPNAYLNHMREMKEIDDFRRAQRAESIENAGKVVRGIYGVTLKPIGSVLGYIGRGTGKAIGAVLRGGYSIGEATVTQAIPAVVSGTYHAGKETVKYATGLVDSAIETRVLAKMYEELDPSAVYDKTKVSRGLRTVERVVHNRRNAKRYRELEALVDKASKKGNIATVEDVYSHVMESKEKLRVSQNRNEAQKKLRQIGPSLMFKENELRNEPSEKVLGEYNSLVKAWNELNAYLGVTDKKVLRPYAKFVKTPVEASATEKAVKTESLEEKVEEAEGEAEDFDYTIKRLKKEDVKVYQTPEEKKRFENLAYTLVEAQRRQLEVNYEKSFEDIERKKSKGELTQDDIDGHNSLTKQLDGIYKVLEPRKYEVETLEDSSLVVNSSDRSLKVDEIFNPYMSNIKRKEYEEKLEKDVDEIIAWLKPGKRSLDSKEVVSEILPEEVVDRKNTLGLGLIPNSFLEDIRLPKLANSSPTPLNLESQLEYGTEQIAGDGLNLKVNNSETDVQRERLREKYDWSMLKLIDKDQSGVVISDDEIRSHNEIAAQLEGVTEEETARLFIEYAYREGSTVDFNNMSPKDYERVVRKKK